MLFGAFQSPTKILLAISGGPDSVALLHLAASARAENNNLVLFTATVDHGLRPSSLQEARKVAGQAHALDIPHNILMWEGDKPKTALQEAARIARYSLLADHAVHLGATHIATAHHQDDQAETFLMRLCHGSGLKGLAAMRPSSSLHGLVLLRPLLDCSKSELVQLCDEKGWAYVKDASNIDPLFTRARLRAIMPHLEKEGLTNKRLALTASRLARADEALDNVAENLFEKVMVDLCSEEGRTVLDFSKLAGEPFEIVLRVFSMAVKKAASHQTAILPLARLEKLAQEMLDAPVSLTRTLGRVVISKNTKGFITFNSESARSRGHSSRIKH
jgi:tRNA(Ile)-lysidine synthase